MLSPNHVIFITFFCACRFSLIHLLLTLEKDLRTVTVCQLAGCYISLAHVRWNHHIIFTIFASANTAVINFGIIFVKDVMQAKLDPKLLNGFLICKKLWQLLFLVGLSKMQKQCCNLSKCQYPTTGV